MLEAMLARGVCPVMPAQGSVGASGDLAPLAHMAAAMIGVGEIFARRRAPAGRRGARASRPRAARARRRRKDWRCSTARSSPPRYALAGLFETEVVFRVGAGRPARLSTDAARGSDAPFDPRIHRLRGHRGQIEVADALRALMAGSAIRASHLVGDERVQDPYCLRCQPQVMGAALDLLRQAATTLATEANGVTDNPLIFADERRGAVGRQFPRRAGRLRRRHDGAWRCARSARSPSGASPCWSIRRCRACRRS